jgi:hypothetical protein
MPARQRGGLVGVITVLVIVVIAGQQQAVRRPGKSGLPSAAQRWVYQWSSASHNDHDRACTPLFARTLAEAFKFDTGRGCTAYYSNVTSAAFRVRRVLRDGGGASQPLRIRT